MAWFAMDCNIFTDPEVLAFSQRAGMDIEEAVGHLARLYAWAAQRGNETGEMPPLPPKELASIWRWRKKPEALVALLLECGLLRQREEGVFLHQWGELNGRYLRNLRKDRERKR